MYVQDFLFLALGIIEYTLLGYFIYTASYVFVFSIAGLFWSFKREMNINSDSKILILIPAYKEDAVIVDSVQNILNSDYPINKYDLLVIADQLKQETLDKISDLKGEFLVVHFEQSTKVKALQQAIKNVKEDYDLVLILDADNHIEPSFLKKISAAYTSGYKSIQGERVAKNNENSLSFLDGVSEAINNHIYRSGSCALGLSSSLIGSGMAFDFQLFKEIITGMDSIGGFDRDMEVRLLSKGISSFYLKGAIVYDEKVNKIDSFKKQRLRWISSQYVYLRTWFVRGVVALINLDFAYFNSSVLRNIQLPRLLNIGLIAVITTLSFVFSRFLHIDYTVWLLLLLIMYTGILIAIPRRMVNKNFFKSLWHLPMIFVDMFLLLFKLKGANKKFIHTPHGNN